MKDTFLFVYSVILLVAILCGVGAIGGIEMLGFFSVLGLFYIFASGVAKCQYHIDSRPVQKRKEQLRLEFAVPAPGLISVGITLLLFFGATTSIPAWMAITLTIYLCFGVGIFAMSVGWLGRAIQDAIWLKGVLKTKVCLS